MTSVIRSLPSSRNSWLLFAKPAYRTITRRIFGMKRTKAAVDNVAEPKDWVSYGFDRRSQKDDRRDMHATFFASVSVALVGGAFVLFYHPNPIGLDWAHREAFLQLRYREEKGLPRVDPNLVDPQKIRLPEEAELEGVEIII